MREASKQVGRDRSDLLVIGFGIAVAMWTVGYLSRMPPVWMPGWLLVGLLLGCLFAGGIVAGRMTDRRWKAGLYGGGLASVVNLLILGSLLAGDEPNRIVPSALLWLPGSIVIGMAIAAVGARIGATGRVERPRPNWTTLFARVTLAATSLLLVAGGIVTSHRAGLAVVDWPNSFGYNMFLYPLSRMSGGIYYEHAHRLFGTLVGLCVLVLTIHLHRVDPRIWLRRVALATLAAVIVQGILGGLRVTGTFTMSQDPLMTSPSLALATVHGVLGQVVFALLVALAVFTSTSWKTPPAAARHPSVSTDRSIAGFLVAILLVQLVLGAIQRHLANGLMIHITMAALVALVALAAGIRAWGIYVEQPTIRAIGRLLVYGTVAQILLGIGAMIGLGIETRPEDPPAVSVLLRTAHQAVGAALLALATLLALWTRRLISAEE